MLCLKATGMDGALHGSSKTVACAERRGHSLKQPIPTNAPGEEDDVSDPRGVSVQIGLTSRAVVCAGWRAASFFTGLHPYCLCNTAEIALLVMSCFVLSFLFLPTSGGWLAGVGAAGK